MNYCNWTESTAERGVYGGKDKLFYIYIFVSLFTSYIVFSSINFNNYSEDKNQIALLLVVLILYVIITIFHQSSVITILSISLFLNLKIYKINTRITICCTTFKIKITNKNQHCWFYLNIFIWKNRSNNWFYNDYNTST